MGEVKLTVKSVPSPCSSVRRGGVFIVRYLGYWREPRLSLKLPTRVEWVSRIFNTADDLFLNSIHYSDPGQVEIVRVRFLVLKESSSERQTEEHTSFWNRIGSKVGAEP